MNKKLKNSLKILVIICLLILSTGCMKANVNMQINKDKSMNLTVIEIADQTFLDKGGVVLSKNDLKVYEDNGFLVKRYVEDEWVGYQLTKQITNIDTVSTEALLDTKEATKALTKNDSYMFTIKKGILKNTYTANFSVNDISIFKSSSSKTNTTSDKVYYSDDFSDIYNNYASELNNAKLEFEVNLPYKVLSNNATIVSEDGKNLVWDIKNLENGIIEFEFELYNMTNVYIVGGVGIALLILIISAFVNIFKDSSKNNTQLKYENPYSNLSPEDYQSDDANNTENNETIEKPVFSWDIAKDDVAEDKKVQSASAIDFSHIENNQMNFQTNNYIYIAGNQNNDNGQISDQNINFQQQVESDPINSTEFNQSAETNTEKTQEDIMVENTQSQSDEVTTQPIENFYTPLESEPVVEQVNSMDSESVQEEVSTFNIPVVDTEVSEPVVENTYIPLESEPVIESGDTINVESIQEEVPTFNIPTINTEVSESVVENTYTPLESGSVIESVDTINQEPAQEEVPTLNIPFLTNDDNN